MKLAALRLALFGALVLAGVSRARAEAFVLTDDFVGYMKSVLNPFEFGRREDGRFYPYSTRYGRRIGYERPVADKGLYVRGETRTEAEQRLRAELAASVPILASWLAKKFPDRPFDSLDRKTQEVLLDHAFTEGAENLPPALCAALLRGDWRTVIDECLYVRAPGGWPDYLKNAAFGRRWIYASP